MTLCRHTMTVVLHPSDSTHPAPCHSLMFLAFEISCKTWSLIIISIYEILQTTYAAFKTRNSQQLLPARAE
jgi:hypothetical protein